jgi:hypothetical protein
VEANESEVQDFLVGIKDISMGFVHTKDGIAMDDLITFPAGQLNGSASLIDGTGLRSRVP